MFCSICWEITTKDKYWFEANLVTVAECKASLPDGSVPFILLISTLTSSCSLQLRNLTSMNPLSDRIIFGANVLSAPFCGATNFTSGCLLPEVCLHDIYVDDLSKVWLI